MLETSGRHAPLRREHRRANAAIIVEILGAQSLEHAGGQEKPVGEHVQSARRAPCTTCSRIPSRTVRKRDDRPPAAVAPLVEREAM